MLQAKHIAFLILLGVGISTTLNRFFITEYEVQWWIAQASLSMYLFLFAYYFWYRVRRWYTFMILVIFTSELTITILGFNLSTYLLPEAVIGLSIFGLYTLIRKI